MHMNLYGIYPREPENARGSGRRRYDIPPAAQEVAHLLGHGYATLSHVGAHSNPLFFSRLAAEQVAAVLRGRFPEVVTWDVQIESMEASD